MRDYKLTRSSRKTVALYIRNGEVEVKAPLRTSKTEIDKFVTSKEDWIVKQLNKHEELTEKREAFSLNYGDRVIYRGKEYPIVARMGNLVGFDNDALCFYMPPSLPSERVKSAVIQIYKLLARCHLTERVLYYQSLMGVSVTSLKINSAKTRWGSMSGKKNVNFSWRLILAEDDIIDLVVVHELAHIKQMNHSDKFWAEVEKVVPDWRDREKRLKELSLKINSQNWEIDWEAAEEDDIPIKHKYEDSINNQEGTDQMADKGNEAAPAAPVLRWHYADFKTILSPKNGMNIYRGCTHGCIYCDSRSECYQIKHDFEDIEVKRNAPQILEDQLRKKRKPCMIATGSMCDPYLPLENEIGYTRQCLEVIEKYGFGVSVLTKSDLVLRDLDILKRINEKTKAIVQMTLTTFDEKLCRILEPNVATTAQRFKVLEAMRDNRIPTTVWLCPILPFINDSEENLRGILDYCVRAKVKVIVCFGIGMTLRDGNREYFYKKLDEHFPGMKQKYIRNFGNSYAVPAPSADRLHTILRETCDKHDIMLGVKPLFEYLSKFPEKASDGIVPEQLTLFNL